MTTSDLKAGDVVQIDPEKHVDGFFAGCFMLVTEPKSFGAQGFVCVPGERGEQPAQAFYRARHEEMHLIGRAVFAPPADDNEG